MCNLPYPVCLALQTHVADFLLGQQDPDGFVADSEVEQEALRQRLRTAQQALPDVQIDREVQPVLTKQNICLMQLRHAACP